ncbi:sensor histidine kinase [Sphingobacterium endophyticum]|uniref:sensor histidine kinase n=1 Tax=Sphingobacterium endophyticum TaxID=2546448 RepID=UPI0012E1B0DC|nr:HAMP domain-containing sensor histidine kinase [Sphingobacterium endophyticum]
MAVSIKYYTNRFLAITILIIMAVWASLFYAFLMDEVYDNIDDGLKNQKLEIIREAYNNPEIIESNKDYGFNNFKILPSKPQEDIDKNHFSRELMYMPYDDEDEPYRILKTGFYSKDRVAYTLLIRTSTVEEDDYLINLAIALVVLYLVIVLSILTINYFGMSRGWKPFQLILQNLSNYRFGHTKSFEPIPTKVKEFQELNQQINKMINSNEAVFQEQKRFLENASHELQTPLAITIGKLDLVLQEGNLPEDQTIKIAEAKQSLHRMVALNKSLLMLSRIENNQYTHTEPVSFNEIILQKLAELEDIVQFKEIDVKVVQNGIYLSQFNAELAQILISNLLRNAIKYNKENGSIHIEISENEIDISNGSHAGALNPEYIFQRFHKENQDSQSNGLGLSIVQTILEKFPNNIIQYEYRNNEQHFKIKKLK